jgi:hypothetical protein
MKKFCKCGAVIKKRETYCPKCIRIEYEKLKPKKTTEGYKKVYKETKSGD